MSIGEVLAWLIAIDVVLNLALVVIRYLTWCVTKDILTAVQGYPLKPARIRGHALVGKHTLRDGRVSEGRG